MCEARATVRVASKSECEGARFALLAGALSGSIPVVIGWTAAGGPLLDPSILILALFMFFWQIAHFTLLLLKYGREYVRAGLPSLMAGNPSARKAGGTARQMNIFFLMVLTAASTMIFPVFRVTGGWAQILALSALTGFLLVYYFLVFFIVGKEPEYRSWFRVLYLYQLGVLLTVIAGSLT